MMNAAQPVAEASVKTSPGKLKMTYEEYLAWADEDSHTEWVNPEYWIIDNRPGARQRAQFYQLAADGQYRLVPIEADGIYRSAVLPGFWLRLEWLWVEEPDVLRAIAEIIGPEQVAEALRNAVKN